MSSGSTGLLNFFNLIHPLKLNAILIQIHSGEVDTLSGGWLGCRMFQSQVY